jgi:hypothetical protein
VQWQRRLQATTLGEMVACKHSLADKVNVRNLFEKLFQVPTKVMNHLGKVFSPLLHRNTCRRVVVCLCGYVSLVRGNIKSFSKQPRRSAKIDGAATTAYYGIHRYPMQDTYIHTYIHTYILTYLRTCISRHAHTYRTSRN